MGRAEVQPTTFISEADVSEQWPILPQRDLRRARRERRIAFYDAPSGVFYRPGDIEDYISRTFRRADDPIAVANGIPRFQVPPPRIGVYFLWSGEECVYVGKSTDVQRRVQDHRRDTINPKDFDSYSWTDVQLDDLTRREDECIKALQPKYNISGLRGRIKSLKVATARLNEPLRVQARDLTDAEG